MSWGLGTTIELYFPLSEGAIEQLEPTVQLACKRGRETVLLVEDNEELREFAREVLDMCGYTVLCAGDGAEALRIVVKHPGDIQLLITDVIMPGMGGRELGTRARVARPDIHILYMSGYAENAITQNGVLETGCNLLEKPFSAESLSSKVHEILHADPRLLTS